jgi:DNA-nicking Smr family endonuclease
MARKRKKEAPKTGVVEVRGSAHERNQDEKAPAGLSKVPDRLSSPFKDALSPLKKQLAERAAQAKAEPTQKPVVVRPAYAPAGASSLSTRKGRASAEADRSALSLAMQGVKPLADPRPSRVALTTPRLTTRTAEVAPFASHEESDARKRLDQLVTADVSFQIERDRDYVRGLRSGAQPRLLRELGKRLRANQTLDLHGMTQREARDAVVAFVRKAHKDGLDVLSIVHGKGHHSEGGQGVLRDAVIEALTETPAALRVLCFVTAPEALGGSGALLVELKH